MGKLNSILDKLKSEQEHRIDNGTNKNIVNNNNDNNTNNTSNNNNINQNNQN